MYTIEEVADKLRLDYQTIYRMVRRGEISAKRFGNQWRIPEQEMTRLLTFPQPLSTKHHSEIQS